MPYITSRTPTVEINGKTYHATMKPTYELSQAAPGMPLFPVYLIFVADDVYLSQKGLQLRRKPLVRKPVRLLKDQRSAFLGGILERIKACC